MRLRERLPLCKGKLWKSPTKGKGIGNTEPEGGAGLESLGKCKVLRRKAEKSVRVRRMDLSRPETQVAKDT